MADADLAAYLDKLSSDEDEHFYVEVAPWDNEPTLEDIKRAAAVVGVELHQRVAFRHDGAKDDPVLSRTRVPVGLTA